MSEAEQKVREIIELIEWMQQVVHCSHNGLRSECPWPICNNANSMLKELAAQRIEVSNDPRT